MSVQVSHVYRNLGTACLVARIRIVLLFEVNDKLSDEMLEVPLIALLVLDVLVTDS